MKRFNAIVPDRVTDSSGRPVGGALIDFFVARTTTRKNTFSDYLLSTPNANPVVCDAGGRPTVDIFPAAGRYKIRISDASGNLLREVDDVDGSDTVGDSVNVRTYGAAGDAGLDLTAATDDAAAFQAAVDDAIASNFSAVVVPVATDRTKSYFVGKDITNQHLIDWRIDVRTNVVGPHNIMGRQRRIIGGRVFEPTLLHQIIQDNNGNYNHQIVLGFDLDDNLVAVWQLNDYTRVEGSNWRRVGYSRIQGWAEGGTLVPTAVVSPHLDASVCTNPANFDNGTARMGAGLWVAHHRAVTNASQKVWLFARFGGGDTISATHAKQICAQKTSATGMFTNYGLVWDTVNKKPAFQLGDVLEPNMSGLFEHEGVGGLTVWLHDAIIDTKGRFLACAIMGASENDSFGSMKRKMAILVCDDPRSLDPTTLDLRFGPSIDIGADVGVGDTWEFGIVELEPDYFKLKVRSNSRWSLRDNEGRWNLEADGDGESFGPLRPTGEAGRRNRNKPDQWSGNILANANWDTEGNRSIVGPGTQRTGGASVPGPRFDNAGLPQQREEATHVVTGPTDTILSVPGWDFSAAIIEVERNVSGGSDQALDGWGYKADYVANTLDLGGWPYFAAGDTFILEEGGLNEVLVLKNTGADETLTLEGDLTDANAVLTGRRLGQSDVTLTAGEYVLDTATDQVTYSGPHDEYFGIRVREDGTKATLIPTTANDTIWNPGVTITDGGVAVEHYEAVSETRRVLPEQDFNANTATDQVTLFNSESTGQQLNLYRNSGRRAQVPSLIKDGKKGRMVVAYSTDYINEGEGEEPTISWCEATDCPRQDYIDITLRQEAARYWADPGHTATYDGSKWITLKGDASASFALPPWPCHFAIKYQTNTIPTGGSDENTVFQISGGLQMVQVQLALGANFLIREYKRLDEQGGNDRSVWREEFESREEVGVDTPQHIVFQYDPDKGAILIGSRLIKMQWPFRVYLGDGFILKESPTSTDRELKFDVTSLVCQELPEDFKFAAREDLPFGPPNLIVDPGFHHADATRGTGSSYTLEDDMPLWPGWSCHQTNGATATATLRDNSIDTASNQLGGFRRRMEVNITAAGTDWLYLDYEFPPFEWIEGGPFWFSIWGEWESGPGIGQGDQGAGIAMRLAWITKLSEEAEFVQRNQGGVIIPKRLKRLDWPIVPRQWDESLTGILTREGYQGIRLGLQAGLTYQVSLRAPYFYQGDAPARIPRPDPKEEAEKIKRIYYRWNQEKLTTGVPVVMLGDGANAQGIFSFPHTMISDKLSFRDGGSWMAIGATSGLVPVGLAQVDSTKNQAILRASPSTTQTFSNGENVVLLGIEAADKSFDGDGSQYRFEVTDFEAESEGDISVTLTSTAGNTVLSPNTDYFFSEQYGPPVDQPPVTAGQTLFTSQLSLDGVTGVDVVKINPTSGYETLDVGTDISIDIDTYPHSCELLGGDTIGASDTFVIESDRKTQGFAVGRPEALPLGHSIKVTSKSASGNYLVWDARPRRYSVAAEAVFSIAGFEAETDTKRALARTVDECNEAGFWASRDWIHCYMLGSSTNQTPTLLNLTGNATHNGVLANSTTHTPGVGYTLVAASNNRINANMNPLAGGFKFVLNDAEFTLFVIDHAATGAPDFLGGMGSNKTGISPRGSDNTYAVRCNSTLASGAVVPAGPIVGFQSVGRADASNLVYSRQLANGMVEQITLAQASTSLGENCFIGQLAGAGYGTGTVAMAMVGSALTADQRYVASRAMNKLYNFFRG